MFNSDEEFNKALLRKLSPVIFEYALDNDMLDKSRINDKQYLYQILIDNADIVDDHELYMNFVIYDEFIDAVKCELDMGRKYSAVYLAGACLEHIINKFCYEVLLRKYDHKPYDIKIQLSKLSFKSKVTWYLERLVNTEINSLLVEKVLRIYNMRNDLAHYKSLDATGLHKNEYEKIKEYIDIVVNDLVDVIMDFEKNIGNVFNEIFNNSFLAAQLTKYLYD